MFPKYPGVVGNSKSYSLYLLSDEVSGKLNCTGQCLQIPHWIAKGWTLGTEARQRRGHQVRLRCQLVPGQGLCTSASNSAMKTASGGSGGGGRW
jgi:hypothetical protein